MKSRQLSTRTTKAATTPRPSSSVAAFLRTHRLYPLRQVLGSDPGNFQRQFAGLERFWALAYILANRKRKILAATDSPPFYRLNHFFPGEPYLNRLEIPHETGCELDRVFQKLLFFCPG